MSRLALAAIIGACVAPRAGPPSNGLYLPARTFVVEGFEEAPRSPRGNECLVAPGPSWPAAENAIIDCISHRFDPRSIRVIRDRAVRARRQFVVGNRVDIDIRVTRVSGYVEIVSPRGIELYCIDVAGGHLIPLTYVRASFD